MLLAVCLGIAALCLLALLLYGMRYEREAKAAAENLLKDISSRALAVKREIYLRGELSDIPKLRQEAERLIKQCKFIRLCSAAQRDLLIKSWRLQERINELEARFGRVPPIEEIGG